jgi:hypothetical protein
VEEFPEARNEDGSFPTKELRKGFSEVAGMLKSLLLKKGFSPPPPPPPT